MRHCTEGKKKEKNIFSAKSFPKVVVINIMEGKESGKATVFTVENLLKILHFEKKN